LFIFLSCYFFLFDHIFSIPKFCFDSVIGSSTISNNLWCTRVEKYNEGLTKCQYYLHKAFDGSNCVYFPLAWEYSVNLMDWGLVKERRGGWGGPSAQEPMSMLYKHFIFSTNRLEGLVWKHLQKSIAKLSSWPFLS
jgi:hypothetical protein